MLNHTTDFEILAGLCMPADRHIVAIDLAIASRQASAHRRANLELLALDLLFAWQLDGQTVDVHGQRLSTVLLRLFEATAVQA